MTTAKQTFSPNEPVTIHATNGRKIGSGYISRLIAGDIYGVFVTTGRSTGKVKGLNAGLIRKA